jgi:ribosomal protein S18 acetylase RimI-like enzyme
MGVVAAFRGRGIGRSLINATLLAARAKGVERVDLEVREENIPAVALYRSVGFVAEGVARKAYRLDGRYFNLVRMALQLGAIQRS